METDKIIAEKMKAVKTGMPSGLSRRIMSEVIRLEKRRKARRKMLATATIIAGAASFVGISAVVLSYFEQKGLTFAVTIIDSLGSIFASISKFALTPGGSLALAALAVLLFYTFLGEILTERLSRKESMKTPEL